MVQNCFNEYLDLDRIVHLLMHYKPDDEEGDFASLVPASLETSVMLKERLDTKLSSERAKLKVWLDGPDKASVFSGWLFETLLMKSCWMVEIFKFAPWIIFRLEIYEWTRQLDNTCGIYLASLWNKYSRACIESQSQAHSHLLIRI